MESGKILAERVRELRTEAGVSQQKVADAIGISKVGYQNYEYARKSPSFETLPKLADFFGVSADYLLGRTDEPRLLSASEWEVFRAAEQAKLSSPSSG